MAPLVPVSLLEGLGAVVDDVRKIMRLEKLPAQTKIAISVSGQYRLNLEKYPRPGWGHVPQGIRSSSDDTDDFSSHGGDSVGTEDISATQYMCSAVTSVCARCVDIEEADAREIPVVHL